jgi:peroxiredoxin
VTGIWIVAFAALWLLVVALGLLVLGTLRRLLPLIERAEGVLSAAESSREGLRSGEMVPPFTAHEVGGSTITEADLEGRRSIVLFLSPSCRACEGMVGDLKEGTVPDLGASLLAISDDREQARAFEPSHGITVLVQDGRSLADVFLSTVTPHAFVIDEERRVRASAIPSDWDSLRQLTDSATKGGSKTEIAAAAMTT